MVSVPGFQSSAVFQQLQNALPATESWKKVNAVFQFDIKNKEQKVQSWTLNLKSSTSPSDLVKLGKAEKPDITVAVADEDFVALSEGKLNGQKAFMAGKLKVKGNMMLATKLDTVLKSAKNAPTPTKSNAVKSGASGGIQVPGYKSSDAFTKIKAGIDALSSSEKEATLKKTNAVFQFDIKKDGKVQSWTLDLKNPPGSLVLGTTDKKPDIIITIADEDFVALSEGKLTGQKAFMGGKLKVKGNMMLATKLDTVLKQTKSKL